MLLRSQHYYCHPPPPPLFLNILIIIILFFISFFSPVLYNILRRHGEKRSHLSIYILDGNNKFTFFFFFGRCVPKQQRRRDDEDNEMIIISRENYKRWSNYTRVHYGFKAVVGDQTDIKVSLIVASFPGNVGKRGVGGDFIVDWEKMLRTKHLNSS